MMSSVLPAERKNQVLIGFWTNLWKKSHNQGAYLRVAIVHYSYSISKHFAGIVQALSAGIEQQGHDVTSVNAGTDGGISLTSYHYIVTGITAPSFFSGKVSTNLGAFFKSSGVLAGKRSYAFVSGKGLRKSRLLQSLMKTMEAEGLYLKKSDIFE